MAGPWKKSLLWRMIKRHAETKIRSKQGFKKKEELRRFADSFADAFFFVFFFLAEHVVVVVIVFVAAAVLVSQQSITRHGSPDT